MNREEFDALDQRIAKRAEQMWIDAGRPDGPRGHFLDDARALIAITENPTAGTIDPEEAAEPVIEEAALQANLGEFTSYSDRQGEEPLFPAPDAETPSPEK
jgi:hypothetical protein